MRIAHFEIEADSKNIIEPKSFKLYLNSFNWSFDKKDKIDQIIDKKCVGLDAAYSKL